MVVFRNVAGHWDYDTTSGRAVMVVSSPTRKLSSEEICSPGESEICWKIPASSVEHSSADRPHPDKSAYRHVGNPDSQLTIIPFIRTYLKS